jgi:hypothetical protein
MDVTKIISQLRSELEDIEIAIRSLEHYKMNHRSRTLHNGHTLRGLPQQNAVQSVIEIRRGGEQHNGS